MNHVCLFQFAFGKSMVCQDVPAQLILHQTRMKIVIPWWTKPYSRGCVSCCSSCCCCCISHGLFVGWFGALHQRPKSDATDDCLECQTGRFRSAWPEFRVCSSSGAGMSGRLQMFHHLLKATHLFFLLWKSFTCRFPFLHSGPYRPRSRTLGAESWEAMCQCPICTVLNRPQWRPLLNKYTFVWHTMWWCV